MATKAVLQAAVEARDTKLTKMETLQASFDRLSVQVGQLDNLRRDLRLSEERCTHLQTEAEESRALLPDCEAKLAATEETIAKLEDRLEKEEKVQVRRLREVDTLQLSVQMLKAENARLKA